MHVGGTSADSCCRTGTRTSRAAVATAASADVRRGALAVYAYGSKRRSIALSASWMARWLMASRRASAGKDPTGEMQAATAALPAVAFQALTVSELAWRCAAAGAAGASSARAAAQ